MRLFGLVGLRLFSRRFLQLIIHIVLIDQLAHVVHVEGLVVLSRVVDMLGLPFVQIEGDVAGIARGLPCILAGVSLRVADEVSYIALLSAGALACVELNESGSKNVKQNNKK